MTCDRAPGEPTSHDASVAVHIGTGHAPDLVLIEALVRLQLAAKRVGGGIHVHDASAPLVELLELAGLAELLVGEDQR